MDIYDESIFHRMARVMNPSNVTMKRKTRGKGEFRRTRPHVSQNTDAIVVAMAMVQSLDWNERLRKWKKK